MEKKKHKAKESVRVALPSHWLPGAAVQTRLRGRQRRLPVRQVLVSDCGPGQTGTLLNRSRPGREGAFEGGDKEEKSEAGEEEEGGRRGKKKRERVCWGERRKIKAPHARKRGARSAAVLFMLLLSQVLIVPAVHHFQLPAPGPSGGTHPHPPPLHPRITPFVPPPINSQAPPSASLCPSAR